MTVNCKNCYKSFDLDFHDQAVIRNISTAQTYGAKLDGFMCIDCLRGEYGEGDAIYIARQALGLHIDKNGHAPD